MPTQLRVLETRNDAREWFNNRVHERNMTQDDVARSCAVNIRTLRAWLSNSRVSRDQVPGVCEALDVKPEELARYFHISDPHPYPRRKGGILEKMENLAELLRVVLGAECEKITLADLEYVISLPLNFVAGLSAEEVTTVQTLLRARHKKTE